MPNGAYGVFFCPKSVGADARQNGLLASADRAARAGRTARAHTLLRQANALVPGDVLATVFLADIALQRGFHDEALAVLEHGCTDAPDTHHVHLMLAQLQARLSHVDAARAVLTRLLALPVVDPALLAEATALQQQLA